MPKHKVNTHRFAVSLPESLYRHIEIAAREEGISQSEIVRRAVIKYLGIEP